MFLPSVNINPQSSPAEIVNADYRTAKIFQRLGIQYCCGVRMPLETVCSLNGFDLSSVMEELRKNTRITQLPSDLPFDKWKIDFLIDYIVNIHHYFIRETFPSLGRDLTHFAEEHRKKYPFYITISAEFEKLQKIILPHISHEEETIFPYLRQVSHAYEKRDSFAELLVRTLRKPIAKMINDEHAMLFETINRFREWTNEYNLPQNACSSHRVILSKLRELDNDLTHHIYLENEVLFPKILKMEKELLGSK